MIQEAVERALATQDTVNAFISVDESAGDNASGGAGPLSGIPIGLKDLIDHAGRVNTCGSIFYRNAPAVSATCVTRLEDAGATIIGRTNLHEFAFGFNSENLHWGPVRNPWDLETSAGGSSGGSGAAVAAGVVPLTIGTDTGGSVRVPAALCGTYGLKVTYDAIPTDGVFPLVPTIDTVGPLASSMTLIEASYRVMADDWLDLPEDQNLRLGIPSPWFDEAPLDDRTTAAFNRTVDQLRGLGHTVTRIEVPGVGPAQELIDAIGPEVRKVHAEFRRQGLPYDPAVEQRIEVAENVSNEEAERARAWQKRIRAQFGAAFDAVDLLVTPTVPAGPKAIGQEMIGDLHHRAVLSYFTAVVNHALVPAIALPLLDTGSPPVSLQAIGPLGSDRQLIGFGHALDRAGITGFQVAPPNAPMPGDE